MCLIKLKGLLMRKKGKAISDDQLIDNTEKLETKTKSSYFADTLKLKELAISFVNQLSGKNELKVRGSFH